MPLADSSRQSRQLIEELREHGAISRKAKRNAMIALVVVFGLSLLLGVSLWLLALQAGILLAVAVFTGVIVLLSAIILAASSPTSTWSTGSAAPSSWRKLASRAPNTG